MPHLRIHCFNNFQVTLDGHPITDFRSAKGRALLVYLAVEQDHPQQRPRLAGLLWPDETDDRARRNLSQTLLEVRRTLSLSKGAGGSTGSPGDEPDFFEATSQTLRLNPAVDHWVDVTAFTALLTAVHKHSHAQLVTCDVCTRHLAQAVALYRGAFLADFVVPESDLFENWLVTRREHLHQQAVAAFTDLSRCYQTQGDLIQAQQTVRRLLELAPWQEEAHRQLMLLLALSGQRTQALAQYDRCTQMLMDELGVPPAKETDTLYDQILAGEIESLEVPTGALGQELSGFGNLTALRPPFQVLMPPPHFVGRRAEITQLQAGLTQPGAPIYALVGMGGAGKTTLASQVAHQVKAHFADGVLWANAATSDALDILASWARAYGYDFSGLADVASRGVAVRGILADKAVLLVLDNVLEASKVQPLLPSGACNPVLLTTRDLDVASALNAQPVLLGELSAANSRQLLAHILGEERVKTEEAAAAQIGALLHYLPLAVEIVAQRLKSRPRQPLAQMAERLQHEEHRLGLEISDRAVRASFEVSWQALDEDLQRIFALQAVFAGRPFSADAVAYLAGSGLFDIEDQLYTLVALSLLREEGERYFRQHPLLADFAREKLTNADQAYARITDYYYNFVQENKQKYATLEPEWGNLAAAIETAYQQGRWSLIIDFTDALANTWLTRGRFSEARHAYALAQKAAIELDDQVGQATALLRWGEMCIEQNDYAEARQLLTGSQHLHYNLEEDAGIAATYYYLARVDIEQNRYDEAATALAQSLAIRQELGDQAGIAKVLVEQARIHYDLEAFAASRALVEKAVAIQEQVGAQQALLPSWRMLAQIALLTGEYEQALSYAQQAQILSEALHDEGELAAAFYTLTCIYRYQQSFDLARLTGANSLDLCRRRGLRNIEALTLYQLSHVDRATGNVSQALELCLKAIEISCAIHDELQQAYSLLLVGDLYDLLSQTHARNQNWLAAETIAQRLQQPWLIEQLGKRHTSPIQ